MIANGQVVLSGIMKRSRVHFLCFILRWGMAVPWTFQPQHLEWLWTDVPHLSAQKGKL